LSASFSKSVLEAIVAKTCPALQKAARNAETKRGKQK
jgi:hypothetical protein